MDDELVTKAAERLAINRFCRQHDYIPRDKIKGIIPDVHDEDDARAALAVFMAEYPENDRVRLARNEAQPLP